MIRKEGEYGIHGRVGHLKNPRRQRVFEIRAAGNIDPLNKKVSSISPRQMEILPPMDDGNIDQTFHGRPQIRQRKSHAHERLASDLTCNEADVDDLLSAGELT
jgi:hypothetical protein